MKRSWFTQTLALIFTVGFASVASAQSFVVATMVCDNLSAGNIDKVEIPVLSIGSDSALVGEIWITTEGGEKIFTGYQTEFPASNLGIERYSNYERFDGSIDFERQQLGLRDGESFPLTQTATVLFHGDAREAEPAFQLNAEDVEFSQDGNVDILWEDEDLSALSCYLISPYPVWGDRL